MVSNIVHIERYSYMLTRAEAERLVSTVPTEPSPEPRPLRHAAKPSVGKASTPKASQITKSSVYLTWPTVKGATGYRIYREGIGEPIGHSLDGKYRASGLAAGKRYRFAVAAMVGGTTGAKSGWVTATTKKK